MRMIGRHSNGHIAVASDESPSLPSTTAGAACVVTVAATHVLVGVLGAVLGDLLLQPMSSASFTICIRRHVTPPLEILWATNHLANKQGLPPCDCLRSRLPLSQFASQTQIR